MTKKIAVIGAGLAGITFASKVKGKFNVEVFEKSRGVGGRMSTRRENQFTFDHGAQFFKIKTNDFWDFFSELLEKKIIQPWNFKLAYFDGRHLKKIKVIKNTDNFFVGVPNMDSTLKHLSKKCNVILNSKIERTIQKNGKWNLYDQNKKFYGPYDWVILSLPAQQSLELLTKKSSFCPLIEKIKMKGCFSLMVGINKPLHLDYDAAIIQNQEIAWLALNHSKPCRMNNHCLLVNSSYEYADQNMNSSKDKVLKHLLNVSSNLINYELRHSTLTKIHQWKYVEAECSPIENYFIDHNEKVAVCGDWFIDSRVEGAFLSANELSKEFI